MSNLYCIRNPKTGDTSNPFEMALLMLCSGTGLVSSIGLLGYSVAKEKEKAKVLKKTRY